jgi:hypothetical protein
MPADWDVEAALEEVVDAIDEGSVRLKTDDPTRKDVKDLYRAGFEARSEAEWRASRSTILDLARKAGACAEAATLVLWVNGVGTVSKALDRETVLLACVIVSRLHCTLTKGVFCPDVKVDSPKGKKLNEILSQIDT